jgi:hypothetical protein
VTSQPFATYFRAEAVESTAAGLRGLRAEGAFGGRAAIREAAVFATSGGGRRAHAASSAAVLAAKAVVTARAAKPTLRSSASHGGDPATSPAARTRRTPSMTANATTVAMIRAGRTGIIAAVTP